MKMRVVIILLLFFCSFNAAFGQWNWPEDKATAEEKNAYYTDNMKNGLYRHAADGLNWLLHNAPNLNSSIYINGAKIYEWLSDQESDPAQKTIYQDSSLLMYDLRIKYFNKEASVINRKAYNAYKFQKGRKDKYEELFKLFQRAFELNKENVLDNNLVAYLDVVRRYKAAGGSISDEEIFAVYSEVNDIIDIKVSKGKNIEFLEKSRDNIDKLLTSTVTVDCEFVEANLAPKMEANPENLKMAKKVFQLLLTGKCSESPYFVTSAKIVHNLEPSYGLAIVIAKKEITAGSFEDALKYYNEALELTDDNIKKGEIHLDLATAFASKGNKVSARTNALKSVEADPTKKEAYSLIGTLYMQSYDECRGGNSKVADRGAFLAAYQMYQKAGDKEGMENARSQFPSIEEIFELDMKEGDNIRVGCWINETVVLQRRPS